MSECFESFSRLFGSDCQSVIAVLIFVASIVGSGLLYYFAPWIWKHVALKYNFHLQFIDHPPPNHSVHNFWFPYSLPIGTFKLCCFAQARHPFNGIKFNFRFLNEDQSNVPLTIINIMNIEECECDPAYFESIRPDTEGGMDAWYKSSVPALGAGEGRYFLVTVEASKPWSGYLSFRMQDAHGFRSYGIHAVTISELPDSPLLIRETVPRAAFISMRDAATKLYTESRVRGHRLASIAENLSGWSGEGITSGTPEDILDYMATYIASSRKVPLFGKRVPSTVVELISSKDLRACTFTDGATKLERNNNNDTVYIDLAIEATNLEKLVQELNVAEDTQEE